MEQDGFKHLENTIKRATGIYGQMDLVGRVIQDIYHLIGQNCRLSLPFLMKVPCANILVRINVWLKKICPDAFAKGIKINAKSEENYYA